MAQTKYIAPCLYSYFTKHRFCPFAYALGMNILLCGSAGQGVGKEMLKIDRTPHRYEIIPVYSVIFDRIIPQNST